MGFAHDISGDDKAGGISRKGAGPVPGETALTMLFAELAHGSPLSPSGTPEGRACFFEANLCVGLGAEQSRNVAGEWFLWLWETADHPMRATVPSGELPAYEAAIDLHRGDTPDKAAAVWRQARREFAATVPLGDDRAAGQAVAASLWDLNSAPGAMADVARTWINGASLAGAIADTGWNFEEFEACRRMLEQSEDDPGPGGLQVADIDAAFAKWAQMHGARVIIADRYVEELRAGLLGVAAQHSSRVGA